jgi:hypothetical protein
MRLFTTTMILTALTFPALAQQQPQPTPQDPLQTQMDLTRGAINRFLNAYETAILQQRGIITLLTAQNAVPVTCPEGLKSWTKTDDKGTLTRGCEVAKDVAPTPASEPKKAE